MCFYCIFYRGVKPVNDVTVKTVLKSYHLRLRKEGRWTEPAARRPAAAGRTQRAPVEEVTSQVNTGIKYFEK